jgi:DUF971 family protein
MTSNLKFTLKSKQQTLDLILNNKTSENSPVLSLKYEYLRIFSPSELQKANSNKNTSSTSIPQVFHKKNIQLIAIEPLGKHGHRFLFDDGFNDIYSNTELLNLSHNVDENWSRYINNLSTTNSREESICFKNVT